MVATTISVSAAVLIKAGSGVNTTLKDGGSTVRVSGDFIVDRWINEAESTINDVGRYDFVGNYSSLSVKYREIAREIVENLAAIYCITYDMSGYTSRVEAESMINVLRDGAIRGLSIIKDKKAQDFIDG